MSDNTGTGQGDFWFNVVTKQVEVGAQSDWTQLLGPYATRAEAEKAMETVERRNEAWDAEDDS
jgi:hypothetical protein